MIALLIWGVYSTLWTLPSDQGSINQAILNGEYESDVYLGPSGNGTIITPGSQAQFIVWYRTQSNDGRVGGDFLVPSIHGFGAGPFLWAPSSTLTSYERDYAIYTLSFETPRYGSGNFSMWFTGPLGNLTAFDSGKNGGLEGFNTAILEASAAGNYTLHYVNRNTSANVTGKVVLGPSLVNYTRPYFYSGLATIIVAAGLSVVTGFSLKNTMKTLDSATDNNS